MAYNYGYDANLATVGIGESNEDVSAVQRWLLANYPPAAAAGLGVSGTYDEQTAAIVRQWKAEHPGYGGDPTINQFVIPRTALDSAQRQAPGSPAQPGTPAADAQAQIKGFLDQWGLGSLTTWAWSQLSTGRSANEILLDLRNQQAYKDRFAGNAQRVAAGLPALSESEYLAYENQARQAMRAMGMPADFYDQPSDFADFIAKDVSVSELTDRIKIAAAYASSDPTVNADERAQLQRLYGTGGMAAYYLDPQRAMPALQKQIAAASSAAAASRSGFGELTLAQAEQVGQLSPSIAQTAQMFTELAKQRELMTALPGEVGVDTISADEQIAAGLGNAQAGQKISRRAAARAAAANTSAGNYAAASLGRSTTADL